MARQSMPQMTRRAILVAGTATTGALLVPALATGAGATTVRKISVGAGETYELTATTRLNVLTIAEGGSVTVPDGYSLSMTVNGVDTGEAIVGTGGTDTAIQAGTYRGDIVLTVATANAITYNTLVFPFRQAIHVDADGVVKASSVLAGVVGGRLTDAYAKDVRISSTGEAYNGVFAAGSYTLQRPRIRFTGNGRSDFVGYGAAVLGTGTDTTLVVEGADIDTEGVVRTAVIADGGSNVIVKDSRILTKNGVLPDDYQSTVNTPYMEDAPWMLGISGNVRATNLLGTATKATYINSSVFSEAWGALSVDNGSNTQLTAINCEFGNTGIDGYGTYAIGNATERILGSRLEVATYAAINRGGAIYYGDSTRAAVAQLNEDLELGLTARELAAIPVRPTVINSRRWGFMWHGAGSVDISGGTVVNSEKSTFLDKGQQVTITVDGSEGAKLNPRNGIILQVMEDDDPGPVMVDGVLLNAGVYTEPTGAATKTSSFDVTAVHTADAAATFTDIALKGDFYNAMRKAKNLVLTFDGSRVEGVISATSAVHAVSTITSAEYRQLGEVTNTAQAAVNNGVIVTLGTGSSWKVTGTSHLTKLVLASDASVTAPRGKSVTLTVDGTATALTAGSTYSGALVLTVG
ncbi:hypothetical protein [Streptomyces sp. NBC_01262]|uniref:hypothetical protein n=1 Tax=Streptomyces sp. NBC_01262 TaxID=2903803 RepID=UPI002E2F6B15|nr:hypothetical protein [Streptomyces sp. NBC_01262]